LSRDKVTALERVQDIDLQIDEVRKNAGELPARVAELTALANRGRAAADLERGRLADNERARRQQETLLAAEKDKVRKWEARLPSLKHPREFAALQREVEGAKRQNLAIDEELGRLREEAEPIKTKLRELEAEAARREGELAAATAESKAVEAEFREKLQALESDRAKAVAKVGDERLSKQYQTLRGRRPGKVVVSLALETQSCSGCHRRIAPQMVNRLLAGAVESCPSCSRLLFASDSPPADQARA